MLGEFFLCGIDGIVFLPHIVSHRALAGGKLSTGDFKDCVVYAGILRELVFIAGVIKLRKICIFVVYSY